MEGGQKMNTSVQKMNTFEGNTRVNRILLINKAKWEYEYYRNWFTEKNWKSQRKTQWKIP